jgi:hypothetical protein
MSIFYLFLTWGLLGIIIGALALAARLKPITWGRSGWPWLLLLGLAAALLGGLLGFWLVGRLFSAAAALWLAVLVVCAPWGYSSMRTRLARGR